MMYDHIYHHQQRRAHRARGGGGAEAPLGRVQECERHPRTPTHASMSARPTTRGRKNKDKSLSSDCLPHPTHQSSSSSPYPSFRDPSLASPTVTPAHVCTCRHACTCTRTRTHTHACMHVCTHTHTHTHARTHARTRTHARAHTRTHACSHARPHADTHMHRRKACQVTAYPTWPINQHRHRHRHPPTQASPTLHLGHFL